MAEGHRYKLIGLSGRERFQAGCSCGWHSKDVYTNAGLASAAHTGHVEAVACPVCGGTTRVPVCGDIEHPCDLGDMACPMCQGRPTERMQRRLDER